MTQTIFSGSVFGFYLLAIVAIVASLRVITQANPVHALLNMIVTLLALSGVFFAIGAPFAGGVRNYRLCRGDYGFIHLCDDDVKLRLA